MGRRTLLATVGWLVTAVLATGIGLGAIRLVGEGITGTPGGVLSQEEIERALANPPPTVPGGSTTSGSPVTPVSPSTTPGGPEPTTGGSEAPPSATAPAPTATTPSAPRRVFAVAGGSVVAECRGTEARLVSWTPAQGYRTTDVDRGPDDDVDVTFEGPGGEYELKVECQGGIPVAVPDDD
ncbi:septum formation initiator [Micromonospora sp. NPDC000207]|uniref:septum formation initiator n=1 Tax=Micromonospora sp. NPDC000207 TaxID=3154246 RepID=UPI0033335874